MPKVRYDISVSRPPTGFKWCVSVQQDGEYIGHAHCLLRRHIRKTTKRIIREYRAKVNT